MCDTPLRMSHQDMSLGRLRYPKRPNSTQSRLATSSYQTRQVCAVPSRFLHHTSQIYNMGMELLKQAIGIDISKDTLAVCFGTIDYQQNVRFQQQVTLKNTAEGFAELMRLVKECRRKDVDMWFLVEATGVYYENLAYYLYEQEQKLCVMLPNYVKQFARSTSTKTKTDRVDAQLLCRMALERQLDPWGPSLAVMRELKELTRERSSIVGLQSAAKNRLSALDSSHKPSKQQITRVKQQLALYKKQLQQIGAEIKRVIARDPAPQKRIERVTEIKGVGLQTVTTLLAETNGFALVRSVKQLISYVGLDVAESQSGQQKGQERISKRGNRRLRSAMYMPALSAIKHDAMMRRFYDRICEGYPKTKKPGIVAVIQLLQDHLRDLEN